jgi:hypothetical protein
MRHLLSAFTTYFTVEGTKMSYESQELAFSKVTQWLTEYSFKLQNVGMLSASDPAVKFYCEVRMYEKRPDFFKIIIGGPHQEIIKQQSALSNSIWLAGYSKP